MGLFNHDDKDQQDKQRYDEAQRRLEEARHHQEEQQQVQSVHPAPTAHPGSPVPGLGNPTAQAGGTAPGAGAGMSIPSQSDGHGVTHGEEGFTSYTVQKDETLSGIAQRFYGRASAWHAIFEANRDTLHDADHVRAGQVIRIPKSAGSGAPHLA